MNVKEYISSGIVEYYVLGLANDAERKEFERHCAHHPELVEARKAFEDVLERFALENGIVPSEDRKPRFLEVIQENPSINQTQTKVITMENANQPVKRSNWLAVASVILLIACAYFAWQFYSTSESLKQSNKELQTKLDSADNVLQQIIAEQRVFKDSNVTVVNMEGTKLTPRSSANVYWDSASTSVYLVVKNMPKLPNDQQYQLWALIDGQAPADLGVFDSGQEKLILKMKNTQRAKAFAITIEKKGGNPSPTLDKMQSMGQLKAKEGL